MPKQTKRVVVSGGRSVTTPTGSYGCKVGNRKDGKPAPQLKTEELNRLLGRDDNKRYHRVIRNELAKRGE